MAGPTNPSDARAVLESLVGQPLQTLTGRPNRILEVRDGVATVATGRSPGGTPVPIAMVQDALDRLLAVGELQIDVSTVGHRSAFVGAVLRTLPGARVGHRPQRIILDGPREADPRLTELARREEMWHDLTPKDGVAIATPGQLKETGVYGGAGGVWVDKATTGPASPNGSGVAVAVLHTGRHYPDDLSDDGVLYHYPSTDRPAGRDRAEIEALKDAGRLRMPLFVITEADAGRKRMVRRGWVEDWDDESRQALVSFEPVGIRHVSESDEPFELLAKRNGMTVTVAARPNQQRFKLDVLKRYGPRCAMCSVSVPELIKAAHLVPFRKGGTDDPRNGLPLCANHHDALDRGLVRIDPSTSEFVVTSYDAARLGISERGLSGLRARPHPDALQALWEAGSLDAPVL